MHPINLRQDPKIAQGQNIKLLPTIAMQQAFRALQLPVIELAEWLQTEIEQNPLLEYVEERKTETKEPLDEQKEIDFERSQFEVLEDLDDLFTKGVFPEDRKKEEETLASLKPSLFEHLMGQAREFFSGKDLEIAETLIGNLDEKGFITHSFYLTQDALRILPILQTFEPAGIAAYSLKDCLLLQLQRKGKVDTLSYKIIHEHYDDLLHNRLPLISKKLMCSLTQLQEIIKHDIAPLDLHPGYSFLPTVTPPLIVDVSVEKQEGKWKIDCVDSPLPKFCLSSSYEKIDSKERAELQGYITSAKWLLNILSKRKKTLHGIVNILIKKQEEFFNGDKESLKPLTMNEIAEEMGLHESTIARAVSQKLLSTPHGIYPLRSFFTSSVHSTAGEKVSSTTAKQLLAKLIATEDKDAPLSDDELSKELIKHDLRCARRTIAKYREALKIPSASMRRKWN